MHPNMRLRKLSSNLLHVNTRKWQGGSGDFQRGARRRTTFRKWWSALGMVASLGLVRIYRLFWESISMLRPKSSSTSRFVRFCLELPSSSSTLRTASKLTPFTYKNNQYMLLKPMKCFQVQFLEHKSVQKSDRSISSTPSSMMASP